jgi:hypothetical protein
LKNAGKLDTIGKEIYLIVYLATIQASAAARVMQGPARRIAREYPVAVGSCRPSPGEGQVPPVALHRSHATPLSRPPGYGEGQERERASRPVRTGRKDRAEARREEPRGASISSNSPHKQQPDLLPADLPVVSYEEPSGHITLVVESASVPGPVTPLPPANPLYSEAAPPTSGPLPTVGRASGRFRRMPLVLCLLSCAFLVTVGAYFLLAPVLWPPTATITISPAFRELRAVEPIAAVPYSLTDPQRQVTARLLLATSPSQSRSTNTTGVQYTPATAASGAVVFYNEAPYSLAVGAGTVLTGGDGVQVVTEVSATVPPGNPPVSYGISASIPVRAVRAGAQGNIAAHDLKGPCCLAGIAVDNAAALSGGRDPQPYSVVSAQDIARIQNALAPALTQSAAASVEAQLRANERAVGSPQCAPTALASPPLGSRAGQVTVSVTVTCRGEAYDLAASLEKARALYAGQFAKELGPDFTLPASHVVASLRQADALAHKPGVIALTVSVDGVWAYTWSRSAIARLVQRVAGMERGKAHALLTGEDGVLVARILLQGGDGTTLPSDPAHIQVAFAPTPLPQGD